MFGVNFQIYLGVFLPLTSQLFWGYKFLLFSGFFFLLGCNSPDMVFFYVKWPLISSDVLEFKSHECYLFGGGGGGGEVTLMSLLGCKFPQVLIIFGRLKTLILFVFWVQTPLISGFGGSNSPDTTA